MTEKKILFVVTSNNKLGDTGNLTGYYLSEVSHPWEILDEGGYEIDFVSPKGGHAPVEGEDVDDPANKKFLENSYYQDKLKHTLRPDQVDPSKYAAIYYAGGHGTMWDFPHCEELSQIAAEIYENGGIVSGVCHGPSGMVNIKLSNGEYLVHGRQINSFTDEEERSIEFDSIVPFLLESKLKERGAIFEKSGLWKCHVCVDDRIITGQNPQSASLLGNLLFDKLRKLAKNRL